MTGAPRLLWSGVDAAPATVLLAHGAGAPMDGPGMSGIADALARAGLRVARFEFAYMAARRDGRRRPPPRADTLIGEFREAVAEAAAETKALIIGGKSMGGRVASMAADELYDVGLVRGLVCLGYPFHPPGKPQAPRTAHLADLRTPTLIFQGTRDPFGTPEDVAGYDLSPAIEVTWLDDGDHDLKPRKTVTGRTQDDHLQTMARRVRHWAQDLDT